MPIIFSHGVIAQLGERVAGSDEVRGSIPLDSTKTSSNTIQKNTKISQQQRYRDFKSISLKALCTTPDSSK